MRQPPQPVSHFVCPLPPLPLLNPIAFRSVSPRHPVLFIAALPFLVKPFALSAVRVITRTLSSAPRFGATGLMA
jgi:hypothetical protein